MFETQTNEFIWLSEIQTDMFETQTNEFIWSSEIQTCMFETQTAEFFGHLRFKHLHLRLKPHCFLGRSILRLEPQLSHSFKSQVTCIILI